MKVTTVWLGRAGEVMGFACNLSPRKVRAKSIYIRTNKTLTEQQQRGGAEPLVAALWMVDGHLTDDRRLFPMVVRHQDSANEVFVLTDKSNATDVCQMLYEWTEEGGQRIEEIDENGYVPTSAIIDPKMIINFPKKEISCDILSLCNAFEENKCLVQASTEWVRKQVESTIIECASSVSTTTKCKRQRRDTEEIAAPAASFQNMGMHGGGGGGGGGDIGDSDGSGASAAGDLATHHPQ